MGRARRHCLLFTRATLLAMVACTREPTGTEPPDTALPAAYRNPVIDADFPDPTVLVGPDGRYYAHATQSVHAETALNIQVASSSDMITWAHLGDAMPTRPAWSTKIRNFRAPHVVRDAERNRYVMYYSARHDTTGTMCLGVATSIRPDGPFADVGSPLACGPGFTYADPMAFDDSATGRRYLYWGSDFAPIVARELDDTRLRFAAGSEVLPILQPDAGRPYERLIEAPWVIRREQWYYLFYSGDNCCGTNPRYAVMVARSSSPLGPFERMGTARGSINSAIIIPSGDWLAPGHVAIIPDASRNHWIAYHAIDPSNPLQSGSGFVRRPMLLDPVRWDEDDWPYVAFGTASRGFLPPPMPSVGAARSANAGFAVMRLRHPRR